MGTVIYNVLFQFAWWLLLPIAVCIAVPVLAIATLQSIGQVVVKSAFSIRQTLSELLIAALFVVLMLGVIYAFTALWVLPLFYVAGR